MTLALHTKEYGSSEAFPLIILHGFLGSSDNWHTLARRWGERYRVLVPDARNHGRSPHIDTFTYRAMVEDLLDFAGRHQLRSFALLGHSMGGRTAMEFAVTYPAMVDKLIVVDMSPRPYPPHHDAIFAALRAADLSRVSERSAVERALLQHLADPAVAQFLMKNLQRDESGQFHWRMNLDVLEANYREVLRGLETTATYAGPTLAVRGTKSNYLSDADLERFRELFPRVRVMTLNAGHWIHAERPDELSEAVLAFLAEQK